MSEWKHDIVRRLVECRCGWVGTPREWDEHWRAEVKATARRVIQHRAVREEATSE